MESINQRLTAQDMGALPRYADGGLIKSIKSLYRTVTEDRKPDEAPIGTGGASQAKEALTTRKQVLDAAEKKAMGMKGGGKVKGKGTGTSDDVPIMASNGEFMVKAAAVKKLGVPFMKKINAIADGDGQEPKKKPAGAIRKMAQGGLVDEEDKQNKAVFGLYPQLAGGKRTTYATDNALRSGVVATGPSTFEPALTPAAPAISANGPGVRMNAAQDPRSSIAGLANRPAADTLATPTAPQAGSAPSPAGGFDNPGGFPDAVASTKPSAQTVLGATGRDVGGGISRYDVPGKSPLFSNLTGPEGQRSNEALMNRGPISAQNQGALDGIQARQDAAQQSRAQKATYDSQVADAQAANQYELNKNLQAAALGTPSFRGSKAIAPSRAAQTLMASNQRATSDQAADATTRRGQDLEATRIAGSQQNAAAGQKLAQDKFNLDKETAGLTNQQRKGLISAQEAFANAKTPGEKVAAESRLRALQNNYEKEQPSRYTLLKGARGEGGVQEADRLFDNQSRQFIDVPKASAAPSPAHVSRLRSNPNEAAMFDEIYGQGAAARALAQK